MRKRKIPYVDIARQHRPLKRDILAAISRVIDRGNFILGEEVKQCEDRIAAYCRTRFAIGINSGTDALFLTLKAYGIGKGDEVITTPNSFLSSTSVIVAAGAKPVFVDVAEDMNIDPYRIEEKITSRTKAIIPVHLTGKPADMNPILAVAKRYRIRVVEDAAQAMGAQYHGQKVGSLGNAGCFSLHPLKTLNACGDGGMITTNDEVLDQTLRELRNIGLKNRDESDRWGYNSRLDTIQAAILLVKLDYLDEWIERRRRNAAFYVKHLREVSNILRLPEEISGEKAVYHTFVIQAPFRDQLREMLQKVGIETKVHYPIPIHLQKAATPLGYKRGDFPISERQAKMIVSLPIYPELSEEDLAYISSMIKKFYRGSNLSHHENKGSNSL